MKIGDVVIIKSEAYDVHDITSQGDVLVRNVVTLEWKWVDYFVGGLVDPTVDPGALLEALSHVRSDDDEFEKPPPRPSALTRIAAIPEGTDE